ncbi:MAG: hypothetical protein B7Z75_09240 [Acidocella sp. 20-57-95]|nr:MAG: hypothetical protein B7Z75_09240 [Acidocella sp. 20-57-95]
MILTGNTLIFVYREFIKLKVSGLRRRRARDEKFLADVTAVSAIEYALLAALISMIIIYAISQIGSVLNIVF